MAITAQDYTFFYFFVGLLVLAVLVEFTDYALFLTWVSMVKV
jgi:hypothetical protein